MQIVFVRHAEPGWMREGLSVDNPPLTHRGHRQAQAVAAALLDEDFDEILVSPLVRARQTAAPILAARGATEHIDPWLEEIANPIWHGTPRAKAEAAFEADRRRPSSERWDGLAGGEPVRDFVARIHTGLTGFLEARGVRRVEHELPVWRIERPERRICLIAHAGTNSVSMCHLLGLAPTPWEWDRFHQLHASISRIESMELGDGHTFVMSRLSDVEHLERSERTR